MKKSVWVVVGVIIILVVAVLIYFTYFSRSRACTMEAKMCPDGTGVGRNPNLNCEFDPCPEKIELVEVDFMISNEDTDREITIMADKENEKLFELIVGKASKVVSVTGVNSTKINLKKEKTIINFTGVNVRVSTSISFTPSENETVFLIYWPSGRNENGIIQNESKLDARLIKEPFGLV